MTDETNALKIRRLLSEARTLAIQSESRIKEAEAVLATMFLSPPTPTTTPTTSPPSPPPVEIRPLAWGKKVSPTFKKFVIQMAVDFRCPDPDWFMAVMAFETIETFRPDIRPRRKDGSLISSAVGLIQFLRKRAVQLGTTPEALAAMTAEKQLEYVWLYYRLVMKEVGVKSIDTIEDCYMLVHWPAATGKPNSATMYVKGTDAYAANAGLDTNRDHVITKAEAGALVRAKLNKGRQPEYFG